MQYILKVGENFGLSECDCDRDNWWNSNLAANCVSCARFPILHMQDNETYRMLVNQSFCSLCSTFPIRSWYAEYVETLVSLSTSYTFASLVAGVCRNLLPLRRSINKLHFVCHNDFGRDAGKCQLQSENILLWIANYCIFVPRHSHSTNGCKIMADNFLQHFILSFASKISGKFQPIRSFSFSYAERLKRLCFFALFAG